VTLQIVRDWVLKFNAHGPSGLIAGKAPGQTPRLTTEHRAALARMVEDGPIPAVHGVVRWRLVDLCQWVFEEYSVVVSTQTMSRELRAMDYRKLSARPKHHAQAATAIEDFKKRMARPVCKGFFESADDQSAATYPASEDSSQPRWRYAHSGPHKLPGVERRFLNQAFGAPFDCQAISISPLANLIDRSARFGSSPTNDYAAKGSPPTTNLSPRRSTAQAILASLLANATMATLGWARSSSALAHRPSGVSRSATWGNAARAPWISSLRRTVASLADAKKLRSAASGELTWDKTQPRRQVATVLESLALADRRDQRRGDCRADARDGRQSTSVLILFCPANELGVKGGNPSIEFGPLGARVGDQRDHPRAQSRPALLIHQHGQELLEFPLALGHNDSALQKDRAQLID
jgi:hypothetical protein